MRSDLKNILYKFDLFSSKFWIIFTCVVYGIIHVVFFSHTEWLNTDYQSQIGSISNSDQWFFVEGVFSNRVPPLLPIVFGLTLKFSEAYDLNILLLSKIIILSFILINAYLIYRISDQFIKTSFKLFPPFFYLLNPVTLHYSFKPLSEHFFMVFFLLFVLKIVQYLKSRDYKFLAIALFAFSIGLLIRPTYSYFVIFLFPFVIYQSRSNITKLFFPLMVAVLTLLPWSIYSYVNSNKIVLSSTGSIQSLKDGIALDNKGYRNELTKDPDIRKVMDDFWSDYSSYTKTSDVFMYYVDQLKSNFYGLAKFQALKISRVFFGTDTINKKVEFFIIIINLPFVLMLLFWFFKLIGKEGKSPIEVFFLVLFIYTILISSIVVPLFRYVIPVFYIIPVLAYSQIKKIIYK